MKASFVASLALSAVAYGQVVSQISDGQVQATSAASVAPVSSAAPAPTLAPETPAPAPSASVASVPAPAPVAPSPSMTTSTVYATSVYTVTSCAPTVTDCPAQMGFVTTEVISLYTTVCPVTETETMAAPSPAKPTGVSTILYTSCDSSTGAAMPSTPAAPSAAEMTTSTLLVTKEYTITACPPSVTSCPVGQKTSTIYTSTAIGPITNTVTKAAPTQPAASAPVVPVSAPAASAPAPVAPVPVAPSAPLVSQISDGQIQATKPAGPAASAPATAVSAPVAPAPIASPPAANASAPALAAPNAPAPVASAPVASAPAASAPAASAPAPIASNAPVVSQISDGQIQATAAASKPAVTVVPATTVVTAVGTGVSGNKNATATIVPFTGAASIGQKTGGLLAVVGLLFAAFL